MSNEDRSEDELEFELGEVKPQLSNFALIMMAMMFCGTLLGIVYMLTAPLR